MCACVCTCVLVCLTARAGRSEVLQDVEVGEEGFFEGRERRDVEELGGEGVPGV